MKGKFIHRPLYSGVGCMDELFLTRCMVSSNDVEETRVWTGYTHYSNIISNLVSILPPRLWRQQIGWSYCAASRTFGLVAWRIQRSRR